MKKIMLMVLTVLLLTSCSLDKKDDETSETTLPTIETTPTIEVVATSTPVNTTVATTEPTSAPQNTNNEGTINETPVAQDPNQTSAILGKNISGTFKESVDNGTTISFNNNGTFDSNLNICSGMLNVSGTYTFDGTTLTLNFPESTGISFLDNDQPFSFTVNENGFKIAENAPTYSCTFVDEYFPQ